MSFSANLYAITCVIVGIALIAYRIYVRRKIADSEHWQPITGTITNAQIVTKESSDSAEYSLAVVYEYAVNGSQYVGNRIEFGQSRGYLRKKSAEKELAVYPLNSSVTVYFNPDKPEEAVLIRDAPYTTLYLVTGCGLLGLGIVILLRSL